MKRVIIKPMGIVVLLALLFALFALAVTARRRTNRVVVPAQTVVEEPMREAAVSDLVGGDFAGGTPFSVTAHGADDLKRIGSLPADWAFNCWDAGATAEAALETGTGADGSAVVIRNLSGRASAQFYLWKAVPVEAGAKYRVRCEYQTDGDAALVIKSPGFADRKTALSATLPNEWRTVEVSLNRERAGEIVVAVQHYSAGRETPLRLRSVRVRMVGK